MAVRHDRIISATRFVVGEFEKAAGYFRAMGKGIGKSVTAMEGYGIYSDTQEVINPRIGNQPHW
jgi:hypothetical protein